MTEQTTVEKKLTAGQAWILGAATIPMIATGALGAWGTYTNIASVFHRSQTALGVVAAGEGATLVLALVLLGMTMLGQSSPILVRIGLWVLPAVASGTGALLAKSTTEAVVFAVTPMAMCVSAEGIGLLARRIVIYRTGVDMEAQRRNAETMQRLSVQRARAANHPWKKARKIAELRSWHLVGNVGAGDDELGSNLVTVHRERMTDGADAALAGMLVPAVTASLTSPVTAALTKGAGRDASVTASVTEASNRHDDGTAAVTDPASRASSGTTAVPEVPVVDTDVPDVPNTVTDAVTQVSADPVSTASPPEKSVTPAVTETVTPDVTETVTDEASRPEAVTLLEQIAAVANVPTPMPAERLSDTQLGVVLRYLRYADDPPRSYRQAVGAFRDAGYVGSEKRVRKAWGELMSQEESEAEDGTEQDEEPEEADSRP